MILPVLAYGNPVLQTKAREIGPDEPGLQELISHMWETMYHAQGVGLAAPQVGESIRLFIVDASPFADEEAGLEGFRKVFINPIMLEESGIEWLFNEGCLSFPELREDIWRKPDIRLRYQDEQFGWHEEAFSGLAARIIQHEYDHIEGIVMTDRMSPLKKTLIRKKLLHIQKGLVKPLYQMKFAGKKR